MSDRTPPDRRLLLRDREVAQLYDVTERTVRLWRTKGAIETVRTPGGRPRTPDPRDPEVRGNTRKF